MVYTMGFLWGTTMETYEIHHGGIFPAGRACATRDGMPVFSLRHDLHREIYYQVWGMPWGTTMGSFVQWDMPQNMPIAHTMERPMRYHMGSFRPWGNPWGASMELAIRHTTG